MAKGQANATILPHGLIYLNWTISLSPCPCLVLKTHLSPGLGKREAKKESTVVPSIKTSPVECLSSNKRKRARKRLVLWHPMRFD